MNKLYGYMSDDEDNNDDDDDDGDDDDDSDNLVFMSNGNYLIQSRMGNCEGGAKDTKGIFELIN